MTRIKVKVVIFNEYNLSHIAKHKVSKEEVVEAGANLVFHKRSYQKRYLAVGRSGTRIISIVLKRKTTGTYYLITARVAGKKERKRVYTQNTLICIYKYYFGRSKSLTKNCKFE